MLVRPRDLPEVYWVGGGAALLVVLRLIPLKLAGKAIADGSDVYLFLVGMMLHSALADQNGVFDWVSSVAVHGARGSSARLFTLVYGIGPLTTIFMSNDATAVVLTPAVLSAVRKLGCSRCRTCLPARSSPTLRRLRCQSPTRRTWSSFIKACLRGRSGWRRSASRRSSRSP